MKVEILQKNYTMSEKLNEIILKKTGRLSKYFDENTTVKVMLKREKDIFKMEITANFNGSFIRSEICGENMYDNIDILLPKIEKQIVKNKGKLSKKLKSGAFKDKGFLYMDTMPQELPSKVARFKSFKVQPQSVEDAVDVMNMLDHDFYVFLNKETNTLQIVYKRHDNDIGVLEPIIE